MIALPRLLRRLLLLLSVSALSACGVVGSGTAPVSISIATLGSTTPTTAVTAYQCVSGGLTGLLNFNDGEVADYTGRMTWTSSNPTVVAVGANTGTLTPEGAGTALITASYYSLQSQPIKVEVKPLTASDVSLQELDQDIYTPITSAGFTIVTNTNFVPASGGTIRRQPADIQQVVLVANENGAKRNVTGAAIFSLKDSGGTQYIDQNPGDNGTVTSTNPNGNSFNNSIKGSPVAVQTSTAAVVLAASDKQASYTLTASLDGCASPLVVSVPLNTSNLKPNPNGLTLEPELNATTGPDAGVALGFADSSGKPLPLVKGYATERLKLTANFPNGQTQDLSLYGQFTSSAPTVAAFDFADLGTTAAGVASATDANDMLTTLNSTAGSGSATNVSAAFQDGSVSSASSTIPTSNTLVFHITIATLNSISLAPISGSSVTATSTIDTTHFHAIGQFSGGISQDVTRLATFSVFSDPVAATLSTDLATINSTPSVFSGLAVPANNNNAADIAGGTVYIGATTDTGGTSPVTYTASPRATLTVNPQPDAPSP